jgi:hypothetical protein
MKFITVFSLMVFSFCLFGQSAPPSKKEVEGVIKLARSQKITKKNIACEYGKCGEWWAANTDSMFYRSDTVRFYNSSNITSQASSFCVSMVWDFEKKNKFYFSMAQNCKEPPSRTLKGKMRDQNNKINIPNQYNIVLKNNETFIVIKANRVIVEMYKVIALAKTTQENLGNDSYVLTMIRQK